jgi:hypothetical protein
MKNSFFNADKFNLHEIRLLELFSRDFHEKYDRELFIFMSKLNNFTSNK